MSGAPRKPSKTSGDPRLLGRELASRERDAVGRASQPPSAPADLLGMRAKVPLASVGPGCGRRLPAGGCIDRSRCRPHHKGDPPPTLTGDTLASPPVPRARVGRVGDTVEVFYEFDEVRAGERVRPWVLLVSLDPPGNTLPPVTYRTTISAPEGRLEYPAKTLESPLVVRVAVLSPA